MSSAKIALPSLPHTASSLATSPAPVNSALSFTGNSRAFAEYRVNAHWISFRIVRIDALKTLGTTRLTKEIVMNSVFKTQTQLATIVLIASFVGLGGIALAQSATAAEATPENTVSYPVRYSDLDVSKMQGAKTLYLRIRYAAETLCESAATWGKKEGEACVNKAVNDAVARANVPLLSQYSQLRSKGEKTGLVQFAKAN
jgi:UrcA family protein